MTKTKTPVRIAVEPLLNDAVEKAEQYAKKEVEWLKKKLEEHNWNIKTAFPYPDSLRTSRNEYLLKQAQYHFAHSLTTKNKEIHGEYGPYGHNPDVFVIIKEEAVERHIKDARETAATQYEMFIMKLEHKIGTHYTAILEGNHIWGESFLFVTVNDPENPEQPLDQCWKTQQIDNCSKLGKWFPQWPTRKVKRKYIPQAA